MILAPFYMENLLAAMLLMGLGWVVSVVRRDVTHVDALWGLGFVLIAWVTWSRTDGYAPRQALLLGLTTVWGVRLAAYMVWRSRGKGEDPRYAAWRRSNGAAFWWTSLFKVFLLQALFLWVIALALQAGMAAREPSRLGILDAIGAGLWLVGFVFESVGDWQLARFKSDPANRGRVMDRGLWRYSRHPNYFGECLLWWGVFVIGLSQVENGWSIVSPLALTLVLLKMTGVPLTEKLLIEKRPAYRRYIERTSAFIPWMPRERQPTEDPHENLD